MMLLRLSVFLLTLFTFLQTTYNWADSPKETEMITSQQGNFSIVLPNGYQKPEYTVTPVKTEVGEIITLNYISYSDDGACMVGMSEYPQKLVDLIQGKQGEILKGAQEGALKNMGATVTSETSLTVETKDAREAIFSSTADGQKLYGKMRLISSMPRLYHILYLTDKEENLKKPEIDSYFNSFKIL